MLSYGILTADHGRVHFTRFGPDTDLTAPAKVSFGWNWDDRYVSTFHANSIFVNSNAVDLSIMVLSSAA